MIDDVPAYLVLRPVEYAEFPFWGPPGIGWFGDEFEDYAGLGMSRVLFDDLASWDAEFQSWTTTDDRRASLAANPRIRLGLRKRGELLHRRVVDEIGESIEVRLDLSAIDGG